MKSLPQHISPHNHPKLIIPQFPLLCNLVLMQREMPVHEVLIAWQCKRILHCALCYRESSHFSPTPWPFWDSRRKMTEQYKKCKNKTQLKVKVIVNSAFWWVWNDLCCFVTLNHVYLLAGLLFFLLWLYHKKIQMVGIEWKIRPFSEVTVQNVSYRNMAHVSECIAAELTFELFWRRLDTKSASTLLYLLLEPPWQPLISAGSSVMLRWHRWICYTPWC